MIPSYYPGEHILVFGWMVPKKGDVVVFEKDNKYLVKRVRRVRGKMFYCSGDNKRVARQIYRVTLDNIAGKVVLKY